MRFRYDYRTKYLGMNIEELRAAYDNALDRLIAWNNICPDEGSKWLKIVTYLDTRINNLNK